MVVASKMRIFSETEWSELVHDLALSPRQADIVKLLLSGLSDKQIARQLHIRVPTVRTHLSRLFVKLGVQDRNELILYVFGSFRRNLRENGCVSQ